MNTHFIHNVGEKSPSPSQFVSTWQSIFPSDQIEDVTSRSRLQMAVKITHLGTLQDAHGNIPYVLRAMGLDHTYQMGVSHAIELSSGEEAPMAPVIRLPKVVFGPSASSKPRIWERRGVRHIG